MLDVASQLTVPEMLLKFVHLGLGGVVWGVLAGYIAFTWCKASRHFSVIDVAVLLLCVYMTFYLGEHVIGVSGVLATVFMGIFMVTHAHPLIACTVW